MIVFVPSPSAAEMSTHLWSLARPAQDRDQTDTQTMFGWVSATDGSKWLEVDTDFSILIHPNAELDGIADILQPWIDSGHLPAETSAQLAAFVESKRGQSLTVYDAFPPFFKEASKTREEMQNLGLLATPTL